MRKLILLCLLQVRNNGQGILQVCSFRGSAHPGNCHVIQERQTHLINFTNPCSSPDFCPPAHLKVHGIYSSNTCASKYIKRVYKLVSFK